MSKILSVSFIILLLYSCAPKITPIKGIYLDKPYEVTSPNSFNVVWDKVVDFFAQKGLSIKIIDRSSGLIVSDKTRLTWSRENLKTGLLVHPDAWIVIDRIMYKNSGKNISPNYVTGEWNVRIKSNSDGSTNINVNLVNIVAYAYTGQSAYKPSVLTEFKINAKSTGNFEKMIAEKVK